MERTQGFFTLTIGETKNDNGDRAARPSHDETSHRQTSTSCDGESVAGDVGVHGAISSHAEISHIALYSERRESPCGEAERSRAFESQSIVS